MAAPVGCSDWFGILAAAGWRGSPRTTLRSPALSNSRNAAAIA